MDKMRIVIAGYGNVGRGVRQALARTADMELVGIVSRSPERVRKEIGDTIPVRPLADTAAWAAELRPDAAILCGGSKQDLPVQGPEIVKAVCTVDSFDNHSRLPEHFHAMDEAAKAAGHVAVISTGWDPGVFSLERTLANAFLGVRAYGFYGMTPKGGLSMGHSDALRRIEGVRDARQYTHAIPEAVERVRRGENPDFQPGDMHTRECFIVAEPGADLDRIRREAVSMPGYFAPYRTTVHFVTQEELDTACKGFPHDGLVIASGRTGDAGHAANIEYHCRWGSNPEATANILVAHARAAVRLSREGRRGAFTILDIPPAYLSPLDREELLAHWM